jgi:hypothetical protein
MKEEITTLRKKLPNRGYVGKILHAEKQLRGKGKRAAFTENHVKNFFSGRSVSPDKVVLILKATQAAIRKIENQEATIRKMARNC